MENPAILSVMASLLKNRSVLFGVTGIVLSACGSSPTPMGISGSGGTAATGGHGGAGATVQVEIPGKVNNKLDLLFMIDNASSMSAVQQKLFAQIPTFISVLQSSPIGLPDLHVAVISSDMGAPSDTSAVACMPGGDQGQFHWQPSAAAACTTTGLSSGSTFIADANGQMNFTGQIDQVIQCIGQLGSTGCGFEHQLASIDRALGADGAAPPTTNANFLRSDAFLGIIMLTSEDDCSAPANTTIYSLNGQPDSLANSDGPLQRYRCNGGPRGGHLCKDPTTGQMVIPPITPPADAAGNPPILNLTTCEDNTTGTSALTPVATFVQHIKALKTDPDNQILVAAITAPAAPYGVAWTTSSGTSEAWPRVMHSCGAQGGDDVNPMTTQPTTDGSFGDPAVRISQFVTSFSDSVLASICDPSYRATMTAIATKLGALLVGQSCVGGSALLQQDSSGQPTCTVTNHLVDNTGRQTDVSVQNCAENGNTPPCWSLVTDTASCPNGGFAFKLAADGAAMSASSLSSTVTCAVCQPGSTKPGC